MTELLIAVIIIFVGLFLFRYDMVFGKTLKRLEETNETLQEHSEQLATLIYAMDKHDNELSRIADQLEENVNNLDLEVVPLDDSVDSLNAEYFGLSPHIIEKQEAFDERIERIQEEIKSGYEAEELHPLVFNLKHDDVPRYTKAPPEEVAD